MHQATHRNSRCQSLTLEWPRVQVYKRVDLSRKDEEYKLWGEFEREPNGGQITQEIRQKVPLLLRGKVSEEPKTKGDKWW